MHRTDLGARTRSPAWHLQHRLITRILWLSPSAGNFSQIQFQLFTWKHRITAHQFNLKNEFSFLPPFGNDRDASSFNRSSMTPIDVWSIAPWPNRLKILQRSPTVALPFGCSGQGDEPFRTPAQSIDPSFPSNNNYNSPLADRSEIRKKCTSVCF